MSDREIVINLIEKLPEDMPLPDIVREDELIAGVRKAREEAGRGEGVSPERARQLVDSRVYRLHSTFAPISRLLLQDVRKTFGAPAALRGVSLGSRRLALGA